MHHKTVFHSEQLEIASELLNRGELVIISAPTGSGRTHFLAGLQSRIASQQSFIVSTTLPHAAEQLRAVPPSATILIDALEHADADFLEAWGERVQSAESSAAVIDPTGFDSSFRGLLSGSAKLFDTVDTVMDGATSIGLPRLADDALARLLHEHSTDVLDSGMLHAITRLADGRPKWALALLELAKVGGVAAFPRPEILTSQPTGLAASALRSVARTVRDLPPESVAAAVLLSRFDPLDLKGIEDLVGSHHTELLLRQGILASVGTRSLYYVPPFVASAIRDLAPTDALTVFEDTAQERLLAKYSLGFPLSVSDAVFCSRPFTAARPQVAEKYSSLRSSLIEKTIVELIDFGEEQLARSLLLRSTDTQVLLSPTLRAAVIGALVGPEAGLSHIGPPPEHDSNAFVGWLGVHSRLSELALTPSAPEDIFPADRAEHDLERVVWLFNRSAMLTSEQVAFLEQCGRSHADTTTGMLADTLVNLDAATKGELSPGSWIERAGPVPRTSSQTLTELPHTSGMVLLSQALTCFVLGKGPVFAPEFVDIARRSPLYEFHARWLRHYEASATALACGDLIRAHREWGLLIGTAPHLIPLRVEAQLNSIHSGLGHAASPVAALDTPDVAANDSEAQLRLFMYFAGKHATLAQHHSIPLAGDRTAPLMSLMRAHLTAAAAENPRELARIAEVLRQRRAWAPALYALGQAREIFLSRRSGVAATECAEQIDELEREIAHTVPSYLRRSTLTSDYLHLTAREREVAALAAEGLANKAIAARLHCSIRTVESHIAQARAKLGAASRKDLANYRSLFEA
ncbi:LuxR C-terminal-related transcriptional regulator [Leucobacter sp. NPDC015123]|uniref:helix-turn-helix transcriptional regulator n=1 Tax=Leucobacter sp. NPDC015123 TaxID=3364129 RepID=UPI0036F4A712